LSVGQHQETEATVIDLQPRLVVEAESLLNFSEIVFRPLDILEESGALVGVAGVHTQGLLPPRFLDMSGGIVA